MTKDFKDFFFQNFNIKMGNINAKTDLHSRETDTPDNHFHNFWHIFWYFFY